MAEKIDFENGRISNFEGLLTLTVTLTLDRVILCTVVSTIVPTCQISLKSKKLFVDERTNRAKFKVT